MMRQEKEERHNQKKKKKKKELKAKHMEWPPHAIVTGHSLLEKNRQ
jgi:hypothetical protein